MLFLLQYHEYEAVALADSMLILQQMLKMKSNDLKMKVSLVKMKLSA